MSNKTTYGSSAAASLLEIELEGDHKLRGKVSRVIGSQLAHLQNFNRIDDRKSRIYARQLWKQALNSAVANNTWPENVRTLTLNVLVYHFRASSGDARWARYTRIMRGASLRS